MALRLLDLFCGAGGAAVGYHNAGFEVVGIDIAPQPHYPFEFHKADALTFPLDGFDAIHASPPCQLFTPLTRATGSRGRHVNLIPPTRQRLLDRGVPYVIENVEAARAELLGPALFCGAAVGLEVVRHRLFETNWLLISAGCQHRPGGTTDGTYVAFRAGGRVSPGRTKPPRCSGSELRTALEVPWMTQLEARQAVPPRYCEAIGLQLHSVLALQLDPPLRAR